MAVLSRQPREALRALTYTNVLCVICVHFALRAMMAALPFTFHVRAAVRSFTPHALYHDGPQPRTKNSHGTGSCQAFCVLDHGEGGCGFASFAAMTIRIHNHGNDEPHGEAAHGR